MAHQATVLRDNNPAMLTIGTIFNIAGIIPIAARAIRE